VPSSSKRSLSFILLTNILYGSQLAHINVPCLCQVILVASVNYKAPPHYAIFSILLLLSVSLVQMFSSEPCSQTPSICVFPLMRVTRFHTNTQCAIICRKLAQRIFIHIVISCCRSLYAYEPDKSDIFA
jgi:hypothetical protein